LGSDYNSSDGFNWNAEFESVAAVGGFDLVIGNPPYGANLKPAERDYLGQRFRAGTTETAALLMLQSWELTRPGGWNAFIVPKSFTYASTWKKVRDLLLDDITELVDVGKVWTDVRLEQVIYLLRKQQPSTAYSSRARQGERFFHVARIAKTDCHSFGFYLNGV